MSTIDKTLGNFEISSQLGKGGMGEVYKANDQKLGREVAIKLLPEEFARGADRIADARLELSPYDVSPDGQRFLVITPVQSSPVPLILVQNWRAFIER